MSRLTGRLVVFAKRSFFVIAGLAIAFALVDYLAGRCTTRPDVARVISGVNTSQLKQDVEVLSRIGSRFDVVEKGSGIRLPLSMSPKLRRINQFLKPRGFAMSSGNARADKLEYLEDSLRTIGLECREHTFDSGRLGTGINLIAEVRGSESPEKIIDVTAHYDAYPGSPGADDNHSAVAGVLEIARLVTGEKTGPGKTIRFIFFDLEEWGLLGSRAAVDSMMKGELERPEVCLNLEMIGFFSDEPDSQLTPIRIPFFFDPPRQGNTIVTVGNLRSYRYGRRLDGVFGAYVPELPLFSVTRLGDLFSNASRSDHFSYWEKRMPAMMLTDTANFRNPNYHEPTDRPETLDYERMGLVVRGAAAFVLDWAY